MTVITLTACGGESVVLEKTEERIITKEVLPPGASIMQERTYKTEEELLSFQNRFDPWIIHDIHQEITFSPTDKGASVLELMEAKYVEAAKNTYGKLTHLTKGTHPVVREGRKVYETLGPRNDLLAAGQVLALLKFSPHLVRAWETEIKQTNDRLTKLRSEAQKEFDQLWEEQRKLMQDIKEDKILN